MFNKPQGCVTARSDKIHKTVMDYFPSELAEKLHPVGRLEKNTCVLLILTDDGNFDFSIMQPDKHISKTYFFYAIGNITEEKSFLKMASLWSDLLHVLHHLLSKKYIISVTLKSIYLQNVVNAI